MSTTAKIAALSKTDTTGITPELADSMWNRLGSHHIAVVGFRVAERTEGEDDSHAVKLEISYLEPSDDDDTAEYLRELQRALYRKRNPQPALTANDATEPNVDGIIHRGAVHLTCPSCTAKWNARGVAHAPGPTDDGYPPCSWRECGHIVTSPTGCDRDHELLATSA